jgi:hypothetical protein
MKGVYAMMFDKADPKSVAAVAEESDILFGCGGGTSYRKKVLVLWRTEQVLFFSTQRRGGGLKTWRGIVE